MPIPRKTPVDYSDQFEKSGMVLITDRRADALMRKASEKKSVPTERSEN